MLFNEIQPFARFPRELIISENSVLSEEFPVDARLFCAVEGNGKLSVEGKTVDIPKGSAILINSGVPYRIIPTFVKYLAINFDWTQDFSDRNIPIPPVPYNGSELQAFESVTFEDCSEFNRYAYCENAFFAEKLLLKMIERYEKKQLYYQLENDAQLILILSEFVRKHVLHRANYFDADAVAEYLQSHYNEEITNKTIAEIFHFHPNYISSEFRRIFGKPLHRYLLELRITKAIGLLETGQYSVEAVASAVGFSDQNYFTRYFKKITGKTPKSIY